MDIKPNQLKKLNILEKSLELEWILSTVLSELFRIEDQKSSISFGQTSQSLSFNQKVNLLIDSRDLNKVEKKNLQCFMEIRNKFMHNKDINTYEEVISITNKTKHLKSEFPKCFTEGNEEEQFEKSIEELYRSCAMAIIEAKGLRKELFNIEKYRDLESTLRKLLFESTKKAFAQTKSTIEVNKSYKSEDVKSIIDDIGKRINILYMPQAMDEILEKNKGESVKDE
jgi:hypothetical protein